MNNKENSENYQVMLSENNLKEKRETEEKIRLVRNEPNGQVRTGLNNSFDRRHYTGASFRFSLI